MANLQVLIRLLTSSSDLVTAHHLSEIITPQLEKCTSDTYVIVSQPGADVTDYSAQGATPHLKQNVLGDTKNIRSSLAVKEVLGQLDIEEMSQVVQSRCGAGHLRVDASSKRSYTLISKG